MSTSTDALLVYGIDLGGEDGRWKFIESLHELEWYTPPADNEDDDYDHEADEEDDHETDSFADQANAFLIARGVVGVHLEEYGGGGCAQWILTPQVITVHRGDALRMDLSRLAAAAGSSDWDALLVSAVTTLGITPNHPIPAWFLTPWTDLYS